MTGVNRCSYRRRLDSSNSQTQLGEQKLAFMYTSRFACGSLSRVIEDSGGWTFVTAKSFASPLDGLPFLVGKRIPRGTRGGRGGRGDVVSLCGLKFPRKSEKGYLHLSCLFRHALLGVSRVSPPIKVPREPQIRPSG